MTLEPVVAALSKLGLDPDFWRRASGLVLGPKIRIESPKSPKQFNEAELVTVSGRGYNLRKDKFHYWLMTSHDMEWWPAAPIEFEASGDWKGKVNVGQDAGPRRSTAIVIQVTPVVDALLKELRRMRHKFKDYPGVRIPEHNKLDWKQLAMVVIDIPGSITPGKKE